MSTPTWHVEKLVPVLISGGFFIHLITVTRHFADPQSKPGDVLLWPVDLVLATLMVFCAATLILRYRAFDRQFRIDSLARKLGYWLVTGYLTISIPGHAMFLLSGNTGFFDGFPWWFSLVILPVYLLILAYFFTLRPTAHAEA